MTTFAFRAARADGEIVQGQIDALSAAAALDQIGQRGLLTLSVEEREPPKPAPAAGHAELGAMFAGLAAMLDAGLPVDQALTAAAEGAPARLATALDRAGQRLREGASLSAALDGTGATTPLVQGFLRAGEHGGNLAGACGLAAAELEREAETRARIRAALTYPLFLTVAGAVSLAVIAGFVVPRFAALLADQQRTLPATTRVLLAVSTVGGRLAFPALVLVVVGAMALARWAMTPAGRLALHRLLIDLPLIGSVRLQFASARVCGALAGLLEAGVPMLAALDHAADAGGDSAIRARLSATGLDVERGERLTAALRRQRALTEQAMRLVGFGEQSGRLTVFLRHAARLEAAAAHRATQRFVTLLEPVLILAFGAAVAFVAAALLQAVYSVRPAAF